MMTMRATNFVRFEGGKSVYRAELDVDTAAELPAADGIDGVILHQGSTALIISEGRLAVLGGDGHWYCGNEVIS